ncbi:MAG: DUF4286 family protein [Solirubrobacterales bacterium]
MAKALMVVGSNPVAPEHEGEFNEWYTETHLDDVLEVAGFGAARRYSLSEVRPMVGTEPSPYGYLAVYEVESDDLAASARELQAALDSGAIPISEHFDLGGFSVDFYELIPESERTA